MSDPLPGGLEPGDAPAGLKSASEVLEFWLGDMERYTTDPEYKAVKDKQWWAGKDEEFNDVQMASADLISAASSGKLTGEEWESPAGTLARIIILDQFPRTVSRGTREAFAGDEKAAALSLSFVSEGWDESLATLTEKHFCYMPLMHSEKLELQDKCVECLTRLVEANVEDTASGKYARFILDFAKEHRDIVKRFGRFPHRNALLGRVSTEEEEAWLSSDDLPEFAKSQMTPQPSATA